MVRNVQIGVIGLGGYLCVRDRKVALIDGRRASVVVFEMLELAEVPESDASTQERRKAARDLARDACDSGSACVAVADRHVRELPVEKKPRSRKRQTNAAALEGLLAGAFDFESAGPQNAADAHKEPQRKHRKNDDPVHLDPAAHQDEGSKVTRKGRCKIGERGRGTHSARKPRSRQEKRPRARAQRRKVSH